MKRIGLTIAIGVLSAAIISASIQRVSVDGKFATSDVIVRNGKTYA
jgi:hypothetical protein